MCPPPAVLSIVLKWWRCWQVIIHIPLLAAHTVVGTVQLPNTNKLLPLLIAAYQCQCRYRYPVLWIRKLFFRIRIRIHKIFFRIRIRIRIRILETYILGQTIPKFLSMAYEHFLIQYYEEKFVNCENMCVFSFNSSIFMLYY
jgi:hypothetical protein